MPAIIGTKKNLSLRHKNAQVPKAMVPIEENGGGVEPNDDIHESLSWGSTGGRTCWNLKNHVAENPQVLEAKIPVEEMEVGQNPTTTYRKVSIGV